MPKTGRNTDFTRGYKEILLSFIGELNAKGGSYDYNSLTEKELLEMLNILIAQSKKDIIPFIRPGGRRPALRAEDGNRFSGCHRRRDMPDGI